MRYWTIGIFRSSHITDKFSILFFVSCIVLDIEYACSMQPSIIGSPAFWTDSFLYPFFLSEIVFFLPIKKTRIDLTQCSHWETMGSQMFCKTVWNCSEKNSVNNSCYTRNVFTLRRFSPTPGSTSRNPLNFVYL